MAGFIPAIHDFYRLDAKFNRLEARRGDPQQTRAWRVCAW